MENNINWIKNKKRTFILSSVISAIPISLLFLPILLNISEIKFDLIWIICMIIAGIVIESVFIYIFWSRMFSPDLPHFVGFSKNKLIFSYSSDKKKDNKIIKWSDIKTAKISDFTNKYKVPKQGFCIILTNGKKVSVGQLSNLLQNDVEEEIKKRKKK